MQFPENLRKKLESGIELGVMLGDFEGERRWLTLTPFKINPFTGMPTLNASGQPWRYRIRCFGLSSDYDYHNYDVHEESLSNYENQVVEDLTSLELLAQKWVADLNLLKEDIPEGCPI